MSSIRDFAISVIETEAAAVRTMAGAIDGDFEKAVRLILDCPAAVLTCRPAGKAGHVAQKCRQRSRARERRRIFSARRMPFMATWARSARET